MPRPVEALPCGSRSTISTRSPIAASAVPRLMAVVVLPTPPFWLAIASTRGGFAGSVLIVRSTTCGSGSVWAGVVAALAGSDIGDSTNWRFHEWRACRTGKLQRLASLRLGGASLQTANDHDAA